MYSPCPHVHTAPTPPPTAPLRVVHLLTLDEPALMHQHPPESVVHVGADSCEHSVGQAKRMTTRSHHTASFTALNILCSAWSSLPSPSPALGTVSVVWPFPECHVVGARESVAFSDWLLSLSNTRRRPFHSLIAHFFVAPNNNPLSGGTAVYFSCTC